MQIVTIYTDGACRGNPGPGGWGAVLRCADQEKCLKGFEASTTNNRMELTAVIMALRALKRSSEVAVFTDSEYVRRGITEWLVGWRRNGWKTSNKKPVKNQDLWQALVLEAERHRVQWYWVKGHSGDPGNEQADALARQAIDEAEER